MAKRKIKIKKNKIGAVLLVGLFGLLFFISIATALVLYLCSGFLIEKLYGNQYTRSVQSLMILVWANPFVFWGVARTKWAIAENAQMLTMIYIILGAVLNVILNIILIPKYSIEGAAVATIISQAVAAVFSNLLSSKSRYLFFLQMKSLNFLWIKKVIAPFIVKK
jgi:PST family polysaccharide transporter